MESIKSSFLSLKRYKDAILYLKEYLKVCARSYKLGVGQSIGSSLAKKGFSNYSNYIGRYKPRVTTQNLLLQCYLELLNAQIQSECYFDALQTCEKIKFFNLHSMNPNDVLKSLESKGYKNFLPNTVFQNFEEKEEFKNLRVKNYFFSKGTIYEQFFTVAKIWMLKCVIFKTSFSCCIYFILPAFMVIQI